MKTWTLIFLLLISAAHHIQAQKGCMDQQASNFNTQAKENDGSCLYAKTNIIPIGICSKLSDTLLESSGLMYYNNWFWTHNDSDNPPYIYAFDSTHGTIIHRTFISNQPNIDWEDITQDAEHIYVGDFGNNSGSRKDLRILVISKKDLKLNKTSDTVKAGLIRFSYADQVSFSNTSQAHDYDMEAFCVFDDSLHLFSKNWADKRTRHYVLAKDTGTYILQPRESFLADGQVTGACSDQQKGMILLTGYSKTDFSCFAWVLWDFKHHLVNTGNRRRFELGTALSFGQNEGICLKSGQVYLSNEKYLTEAGLKRIDVNPFLSGKPLDIAVISRQNSNFTAYQSSSFLIIRADPVLTGKILEIYTVDGKLLKTVKLESGETRVDIDELMDGVYILKSGNSSLKIQIRK
jgi:hypothetical protein